MTQLTNDTIAIVKATAPALRKHGVEITTAMYARLFMDASIDIPGTHRLPATSRVATLAASLSCPRAISTS